MASFKDVIGQKDVMRYIGNALSTGQISHAYIVNGERGSGKKLIANLFAAALLCEEDGAEPCNKCHSCIQADTGNHPDIIKLVHEKENTISVEEVREQINNTVAIMYKINSIEIAASQYCNRIIDENFKTPARKEF